MLLSNISVEKMGHIQPTLKVVFYAESNGTEPVRNWLQTLAKEVRFLLGTDLKKVQFKFVCLFLRIAIRWRFVGGQKFFSKWSC